MDKETMKSILSDRKNCFDEIQMNFTKKIYLDLYIKEIILFCNSIGKANHKKFKGDYFVNEVKNSSMSSNLYRSRGACIDASHDTLLLEFYQFNRRGHLKLGLLLPVLLIIVCSLIYLLSLLFEILLKGKNLTFEVLARVFLCYLKLFSFNNQRVFLMTDHHFFSSIIAIENEKNSSVLQHGLILDKRFYYPIRAGKFCAWGEHSKEILDNDSKVEVTGTYKFDFKQRAKTNRINRIIYCISILNNEIVENKIRQISSLCKEYGFEFAVKVHPGSMFDLNYWKDSFKDYPITFYKEEKITELEFDLAISENSTINIDFVSMNVPFIIYDDDAGYFDSYKDIIPICFYEEDLRKIISHIQEIDFSQINKRIIENELNSNICTIFEKGQYEKKCK